MRSIHHVMRPITTFELPESDSDADPLAAIRERLFELDIPEMAAARTFRVTSNRIGQHPFGSMDVQREAGAALNERYGTAVDLRGYDVNIRVDVIHRTCLVAEQRTRASLSKRYERVFNPKAALKPNVAYAMLRLADPEGELLEREGASLLDPFCGAGTILLEAAAVLPGLEIYGSDFDERCVEGTVRNAQAAGLADRLNVRQADARDLGDVYDRRLTAIITNPPYGVRLGRKTNFTDLYQKILGEAHRVLEPDGRIVLLVFKRRPFDRALEKLGLFETVDVHLVETGGLYPRLYILRPRSEAVS